MIKTLKPLLRKLRDDTRHEHAKQMHALFIDAHLDLFQKIDKRITSETANDLLCFARRRLSGIISPLLKGEDQTWLNGNQIRPFTRRHA